MKLYSAMVMPVLAYGHLLGQGVKDEHGQIGTCKNDGAESSSMSAKPILAAMLIMAERYMLAVHKIMYGGYRLSFSPSRT